MRSASQLLLKWSLALMDLSWTPLSTGRVCAIMRSSHITALAAWLEGKGTVPKAIAAANGLDENLHNQDRTAQCMKNFRHVHGALSLETIEARPIFDGDE